MHNRRCRWEPGGTQEQRATTRGSLSLRPTEKLKMECTPGHSKRDQSGEYFKSKRGSTLKRTQMLVELGLRRKETFSLRSKVYPTRFSKKKWLEFLEIWDRCRCTEKSVWRYQPKLAVVGYTPNHPKTFQRIHSPERIFTRISIFK